uniref:DNA-directed DNA polymerase family A palm domain-containing protein n=1 Tax=Panagrolaimus superbus TaxID=310955 RepID=A0A914XZE4_9BILA
MGPNTLVEQYKFDRDEAVALWTRFNRVFSKLDHYRNILSEEVKQRKPLTNYFGIPVTVDIASAFSAVNAVIQSTSACILLQAVGKFSRIDNNNDIRLFFTVHDEIIFDAPSSMHEAIPRIVTEYMKNEIEGISLPIKFSVGKSWDTLKVLE